METIFPEGTTSFPVNCLVSSDRSSALWASRLFTWKIEARAPMCLGPRPHVLPKAPDGRPRLLPGTKEAGPAASCLDKEQIPGRPGPRLQGWWGNTPGGGLARGAQLCHPWERKDSSGPAGPEGVLTVGGKQGGDHRHGFWPRCHCRAQAGLPTRRLLCVG